MAMSSWVRRASAGIVGASLALGALGGGATLAQDEPTIYVIAPSLTDPFWITQQNGANQAAEDFGVKVNFQAPQADTGDAGMVPLVQAAVAAAPAGIAIDFTSKTMEAATVAALDAGIPVVLYNNNRFEGENAPDDPRILDLAFVGQDESVSGETLANAWLPNLPAEPCPVLIVNPFPTAFVLTLRADGVKRALDAAGYPYSDLAASGDQAQNLSLISAALQADPDDLRDRRPWQSGGQPRRAVRERERPRHPRRDLRRRRRGGDADQGRVADDGHQPAAVPPVLLRGRGPRQPGEVQPGSGEHRHGHVDRDRGEHRHRAGLHRRGSLLNPSVSDPAAAVPSTDGSRPIG